MADETNDNPPKAKGISSMTVFIVAVVLGVCILSSAKEFEAETAFILRLVAGGFGVIALGTMIYIIFVKRNDV